MNYATTDNATQRYTLVSFAMQQAMSRIEGNDKGRIHQLKGCGRLVVNINGLAAAAKSPTHPSTTVAISA
ncbi:MAG: hypothetical protein IJ761_05970 [Bacteroidales bacterium]|nr:hypothetical protein [Bacteroidales bacterium]MBR1799428.1 hypothetical protein [Bacteroidales bacterium]